MLQKLIIFKVGEKKKRIILLMMFRLFSMAPCFWTFFSFVLSVLTRKLTKPIFRPHQSTTWETLPSARGLPVSLSMTFDISQGKSVFSACSIRVSMPKSIRMQKFLNFHCSPKYSLSKVWVGFILIFLNSLYNNEKYHNWWHYSITCNLNLQKTNM